MRGSRTFCQRGGPTSTVFISFIFSLKGGGGGGGGEESKYHYKQPVISPPAKRRLNGVSLMAQH